MQMKRVLIVEDNREKYFDLLFVLEDVSAESGIKLDSTRKATIDDVYLALPLENWDLILLDMTFEISQGEGRKVEKEQIAGIDILRHMLTEKINVPVLIVTQHSVFSGDEQFEIRSVEQLDKFCSVAFPNIYKGTIKYSALNEDWKPVLAAKIRELM